MDVDVVPDADEDADVAADAEASRNPAVLRQEVPDSRTTLTRPERPALRTSPLNKRNPQDRSDLTKQPGTCSTVKLTMMGMVAHHLDGAAVTAVMPFARRAMYFLFWKTHRYFHIAKRPLSRKMSPIRTTHQRYKDMTNRPENLINRSTRNCASY